MYLLPMWFCLPARDAVLRLAEEVPIKVHLDETRTLNPGDAHRFWFPVEDRHRHGGRGNDITFSEIRTS